MKIVLISGTNSRLSGGLFYSVKQLGLNLMRHCHNEVYYVCHDDKYSREDKPSFEDLPLAIYHLTGIPILDRLGYSRDIHKILESIQPDVIDIQGTWMYYSYAAMRYRDKHPHTKIVITPRGTLDRQDRHKLPIQKRIASWLYENRNFETADCFKALNRVEAESMLNYGINTPIAIIPNGFTLPTEFADTGRDKKCTLLFVGRINPKKGLLELIEGVKILLESNPDALSNWTIRIAGWDQKGHTNMLIKLVNTYGLTDKIQFIGPKYGEEKERELLNAQAFILTSFSEGMPMSVLEAWAYKLPVIMTDGCNLPEAFERKAAIRVTTKPLSIAKGLRQLIGMSPMDRSTMGQNGYCLVSENFQWSKIAEDTELLYHYLLGSNSIPEFIL